MSKEEATKSDAKVALCRTESLTIVGLRILKCAPGLVKIWGVNAPETKSGTFSAVGLWSLNGFNVIRLISFEAQLDYFSRLSKKITSS